MLTDELELAWSPGRRHRRLVAEAQEFMAENLDDDLSLSTIAESVALSAYYFSRLFRQVTGVSPYRYLLHLRIARAKELLRESELNVAQVSARVGFRSANHFSVMFRRLTGLSPTAYRRVHDFEAVQMLGTGERGS